MVEPDKPLIMYMYTYTCMCVFVCIYMYIHVIIRICMWLLRLLVHVFLFLFLYALWSSMHVIFHVHDPINEPQLPWLRSAIYHTGLDVKMEVTSNAQDAFLPCTYVAIVMQWPGPTCMYMYMYMYMYTGLTCAGLVLG